MKGKILVAGSALVFALLLLGVTIQVYGAAPPPSIDDLDGTTWNVTAKGTESNLAGRKITAQTSITWTITKTGDDTVSFDSVFGGMSFHAYYVDGFLRSALAASTA